VFMNNQYLLMNSIRKDLGYSLKTSEGLASNCDDLYSSSRHYPTRGKKSENARRISACLDAVLKTRSAQEYFWLRLDILITIRGHAISQEAAVALNRLSRRPRKPAEV
jgi:hypothetical protein